MRVDPVQLLQQNQLIEDYRAGHSKIMEYFDYTPFHSYENRLIDLNKRAFKRDQLAKVLKQLNKRWNASNETFHNIERLKDKDSVVVIGGQQAGLLTGPFYTINKIISIIQLAKIKEKELSTPVIPVFWVAGEDHDYDEINHIFLHEKDVMQKYTYGQLTNGKKSISHFDIDKNIAENWLRKIFSGLEETHFTTDLYKVATRCLENSNTLVDFFAQIVHHLFSHEGLVLIDSGDDLVRELESDYFIEMIKKQPEIATGVKTAMQNLKNEGYSISLQIDADDTHLFYYTDDDERVLLYRNSHGEWVGKQNEVLLTTEDLIEIAKSNPNRLSNNVVTRPVMQELLFPTLAFIGGNGEIAYWASLKPVFSAMNIKMPPVLPRLSFTYIPPNVKKYMDKFELSIKQVINEGVEQTKINWLAEKQDPPIDKIVEETKYVIEKIHGPLQKAASNVRADMEGLAERNLYLLHKQIDFLHRKLTRALHEKYQVELNHFNIIDSLIVPLNQLQERTWNPLQLMNDYGCSFIDELVNKELSFEQLHYAVYL